MVCMSPPWGTPESSLRTATAQSVETLKPSAETPQKIAPLPGLRSNRGGGPGEPDACVDHHVAGREPEDRVQVELCDLGMILAETREPPHQVDERVAVS